VANVGKDAIYTRIFSGRFKITRYLHIVNIRIYFIIAFGDADSAFLPIRLIRLITLILFFRIILILVKR